MGFNSVFKGLNTPRNSPVTRLPWWNWHTASASNHVMRSRK